MIRSGKILLITSLFLLSVLAVTCKKEDDELLRKEVWTESLLEDISSDSLRSYVLWLEAMGTRFALADNHRAVAVKIRNNFIRLGYPETKIDSFYITKTYKGIEYRQYQYNVEATLEGEAAYDSICIIGGHYDNILNNGNSFTTVPGSNDNASGVATLFEIARVMKINKYQPRNTIRFVAFGAEELGLLGSNAYGTNSRTTFQKIMLMLNNDMVAYETDSDKSKWKVNIIDYDNSHYLRKTAEQLCFKYTSLGCFNDNTNYNRSDSYPFFTNGFKPLFFFSAKVDPNYHTLNDLASNCNFEYAKEIVKLNCAILVDKN
jgi:leucyl aminopeptidase